MKYSRHSLLAGAVAAVALWTSSSPAYAAPLPPEATGAGAPSGLHLGPTGLCNLSDGFNWSTVAEGGVEREGDIVYADAISGTQSRLVVENDSQGTADFRDDEIVITLSSFNANQDTDATLVVPKWTPLPGEIGGFTFENADTTTYRLTIKRIEYAGTTSAVNSVSNTTATPMHARGWFATTGGVNGFQGGSGIDCVEGWDQDDQISLGGGDDYATSGLGDDAISGGAGRDTMMARSGDDEIRGGAGRDLANGGGGSDCYSDNDNERDVFVDDNYVVADVDEYVADTGLNGGLRYNTTMDILTDPPLFWAADCI